MDYILPETSLIQIKTLEKMDNNGIFVIEPLSPGYGLTLGNSIRRILLSSLEGAAITSVKIEGVTHEFSAIPGVSEDVVEVILNLKTLRFKLQGDEPVIMKLNVKGPKEVTSSDFEPNASCEVVNKDVFIASVGKSGKLGMEITVEKGRGYVPVERRREEKLPLGTIAVDSIFTPVRKVHYEIEHTRVGQMTNFDKLTLEIATDGSIEPEVALGKAAGILVQHLDLVQKAFETPVKAEVADKPAKKTAKKADVKAEVAPKTAKKTVKKAKK